MDRNSGLGLGALIAAGIGSVCCVGPAIFAGMGLGAGALSFARGFGVIHMPMMILAFLLLGTAFYFQFRKKGEPPSNPKCCEPTEFKKRNSKTILWATTALTLFLFLVPYFI